MTAHVLHFHLELGLAALGCALERHVLQEVRDAVGRICLIPAASVNPNTNCCALAAGRFCGDAHLVRERLQQRGLLSHGDAAEGAGLRRGHCLQGPARRQHRCVGPAAALVRPTDPVRILF
eukprot:scaffold273_cov127-Isochrysis_galbana.AAC.2